MVKRTCALVVAAAMVTVAGPASAGAFTLSPLSVECVYQQRWAPGPDINGNPAVFIDRDRCAVPYRISTPVATCPDQFPEVPGSGRGSPLLEAIRIESTFLGFGGPFGDEPESAPWIHTGELDTGPPGNLLLTPSSGEKVVAVDQVRASIGCFGGSTVVSGVLTVTHKLRGPDYQPGGGPSTGGGGSGSRPDETHSYRVDVKAFIPQQRVADPLLPADGLRLNFKHPLAFPLRALAGATSLDVKTEFEGDGHSRYRGSGRRLATLNFDWDGKQISKLSGGQTSDPTTRIVTLTRRTRSGGVRKPVLLKQHATARRASAAAGGGRAFSLRLKAANPLTPPGPTPNIDASLSGTIASDGTLDLTVTTDRFPSFGLEVQRDGATIWRGVIHNAACNRMTGTRGAARLVLGLNAKAAPDRILVPPAGGGNERPLPGCHRIGVSNRDVNRVIDSAWATQNVRRLIDWLKRLASKRG